MRKLGLALGGSDSKASVYNAVDLGLIPGLGRFLWRRGWQHTPVFLPGDSHGHRSLGAYTPWVITQLDTTERLTLSFSLSINRTIRKIS